MNCPKLCTFLVLFKNLATVYAFCDGKISRETINHRCNLKLRLFCDEYYLENDPPFTRSIFDIEIRTTTQVLN